MSGELDALGNVGGLHGHAVEIGVRAGPRSSGGRAARLSRRSLPRVSAGSAGDRTPIVLAYDHRLLREALRALLEAEPDLRIIGECGDGREVVPAVKRLAPQVLVVRLMMPGLSGLEVTRQVRDQVPTTSVVILSMHATELYAAQGLQHGAAAYVVMAAPGRDLVKAVRAAGSGRRYLSPPLTTRGVDAHLQRTLPAPSIRTRPSPRASGKCCTSPPTAMAIPRWPRSSGSARGPPRPTAPT